MTAPAHFVERLRRQGVEDGRVLAAMAAVPRELFVPEALRAHAYDDAALPIGHDATISQPAIVARICEELRLEGDERVLDVGTGSGYQAAVLAELAAEVVGIERVPELAGGARAALAAAGYDGVEVHVGDGTLGVPARAPFHAIAVAAAAPRPPATLVAQLAPGGRLVGPVGTPAAPRPPATLVAQLAPGGRLVVPVGTRRDQRLEVLVRTERGAEIVRSVPCRFVPLVGAEGFDDHRTGQGEGT